jgi:hypothetical protein
VLNRDRLLAVIDIRNRLVLEKTQNRMIDAIEEMIADCNRNQGADEALRRGIEIVTDARPERSVIASRTILPCLTTSRLSARSAFAHSITSASAPGSKPSASGAATDQPFVGQSDGAKSAPFTTPMAMSRPAQAAATRANHRAFKTRAIIFDWSPRWAVASQRS